MKALLLVLAVVWGWEKQEETQGPSQPEPTTPPQATLPQEPQLTPKTAEQKPLTEEESAKVIEAAIRRELKKPEGGFGEGDGSFPE